MRVGRFCRGATICDSQGTHNLHFCNCAINILATLSVAQAKNSPYMYFMMFRWLYEFIVVVVETLNSLLTLRCYRFTELKKLNDKVKKAI